MELGPEGVSLEQCPHMFTIFSPLSLSNSVCISACLLIAMSMALLRCAQ